MPQSVSRFETLKHATEYWTQTDTTTILIILFFILGVITLLVGGILLQKILKTKNIRNYFFSYAKERELTEKEANILWDYTQKMGRDPLLVLEFKSPFEKVVDIYIKTDPNADENLVQDMRKKLGFNIVYDFIPLSLSKDIEMFQNGKMIIDNHRFDVSLYDKDEKFMYWILLDLKSRSGIEPGTKVKITFLRKKDAIYTFESTIEDVIQENGKIIVKLPHTFEMTRIQRREFPRIEVDLAALIGQKIKKEGIEEIVWHPGQIVDISALGAKFCVGAEKKDGMKFAIKEKIIIKFELNNQKYELNATIENKDERKTILCFGLKFQNINEREKDKIFDFIQKKQKKLAKLAKMKK